MKEFISENNLMQKNTSESLCTKHSLFFTDSIMDSINVPKKSYIMVSHMISLAVKKEVSWSIVSLFLEEISSTIVKSNQVLKILLKELENYTVSREKPLNDFYSNENQSEIEAFLEQSNEKALLEHHYPQSYDQFIMSESEVTIHEEKSQHDVDDDSQSNEEFDEENYSFFFK